MTRDYARRPAAKTKRKKSESYFGLWLFTIIIFISFMLGLVYLGKNRQNEHKRENLSKKVETEHNINISKEIGVMEQQKPKLQFDFDTPKRIDKVTSTEQKAVEVKANVIKEAKYQLDIAMVKDYTAVDKLKAQLALLGFEARVIPVKEHNVYYYKVFVGFYDKKIALEKQQLLKQHKLSAVMRKATE